MAFQRLPRLLLLLFLLLLVFGLDPVLGRLKAGKKRPIAVRGMESLFDHKSGCRAGELEYSHRGDLLCYSRTPRLQFTEALAACRAIGGRLATIFSQEHNDLLYGLLTESAFIGAVARGHMARHPLGGVGPGVVWSWMNGKAPGYTNVLQNETQGFYIQPDGGGFEGCMELMKHPVLENDPGNSYWGDTDCRSRKPALCERKGIRIRPYNVGQGVQWRYELQQKRRAGCPGNFLRVGVKRLGERDSRSTCLSRRQTGSDFSAALLHCQQLDATATIARPARLAGRRRWLPAHGAGETTLFWSGADRRNGRLQWRWQEDGRRVSHRAWAAGEPRDRVDADCAAYDPARRGMVATSCDAKLEFVCESPAHGCATGYHVSASGLRCVRDDPRDCEGSEEYTDQPNEKACTARLCPLRCPAGYSQLGLKCLKTNDTVSWYMDVARACHARQTEIMRPDSHEENEFLRRQTERTGRPLWLAMTGGPFTRWHSYVAYGLPREPNEPAVGSKHITCNVIWFDGEWMDVDCFEEFTHVRERPMKWKDCAEAVEKLKAT